MNAALSWSMMLAVAVGAAIGGVARWLAGAWVNHVWPGFPLGTLIVNCIGGFMIGCALVVFQRWPYEVPRTFFITGFLGGLTTFSAFSGESLSLLQRGQPLMALLHTGAHVLGSLACAAVGFALARLLLR
jgi:CrcB protein